MELLLIWLICGVIAFFVASSKGRSGCGWGVIGLLFGPIAFLAAAMISPDRSREEARRTKAGLQSGDLRPCPKCAEPIKREAVVCRYCGQDVPPLPKPRSFLDDVVDSVREKRK